MNGHNVLITTEDWHKHLQTYGYRQNDFDEILKRVDRIPSNIWFTDHRERVMLFLKATKHKASLDDVRAAHVSVFFSTEHIYFKQFFENFPH